MPTGPHFRSSLIEAREHLAAGREKLKLQHQQGAQGIHICVRLADLLDSLVLQLFESAMADLETDAQADLRSKISLVVHGGLGRRVVSPFSDVDLMILHAPGTSTQVAPLAKRMMRDLFDVGLDLGQSVRTPAQACQMARNDPVIFTALAESRFLGGNENLFTKFQQKFQQLANRHWRSLLQTIRVTRRQERLQFGETVYLLEPNIKRSRGGLREIQLLRWTGFARYGTPEPDQLQRLGVLSKNDRWTIHRASEFLLRLRNEMHFHANKANDLLTRREQVRLAEFFSFEGTESLLPVEQFMREYFYHTSRVRYVVSRFVATAAPGRRISRLLEPLFSRQVESGFRVGRTQIEATQQGLEKLRSNLADVLRLADLSNLYNKRIAHSTWEAISQAMPELSDELTTEAAERFLSLLSRPTRLGKILRKLHHMGALEKIIPAFAHARCLLQFNNYHKYTVDEHCLLAVRRAVELLEDHRALGRIYQSIRQKRTLHLALLIHDLGKGHVEDHSEVGLRIAQETAERLHLPSDETETLKFLVHKHLLMSHLAFRRDTSDESLVVRFAVEVGSPEMLQMLLVLTTCDLAAVGPGVLNNWKLQILLELYQRAMHHLAGDSGAVATEEDLTTRRKELRRKLEDQEDLSWFDKQIDALPESYLCGWPADKIATQLKQLGRLQPGQVNAWDRYLSESRTVEYTVGTLEDIRPGIFHRLTGALTSRGLEILSAEIYTLAEGLVLDRFVVHDPDYNGQPPKERLALIKQTLVNSLCSPETLAPTFRKIWTSRTGGDPEVPSSLPVQVRIDNSTSDRYTILDIFAADRMGLLYTITKTLFELELSVAVAKIATYLDQVVDVFYVTDQSGGKIQDETRLAKIRRRLLEAIEAFERRMKEGKDEG